MTPDTIYEGIVIDSFAKAEKNYVNNKKYKLSELISESIEEISRIKITRKTFVNYYNKYIEKKEGIATPKHENIELLCQYIGYESYKDYLTKKHGEVVIEKHHDLIDTKTPPPLIKRVRRNETIGHLLLVLAFMGIGWASHSFFESKNRNKCLIWIEDHYEEVDCSRQAFELAIKKEGNLNDQRQLLSLHKNNTSLLSNKGPIIWDEP